MVDLKISQLPAFGASVLAGPDEIAVSDTSAAASKKATVTQFRQFLEENFGLPRVKKVGTQHSNSTTTGTEVTDLQHTLEIGTYTYKYSLLLRSATTTVGPMLGVNFTGTGNPRSMFYFPDQTAAITAEQHIMSNSGSKAFGYISGMASSAKSTTAPDMGTTVGVQATATDLFCVIEGLIIVTAAGDLELWHSSETASATTVEVGSSCVVIRTA